MWEEQDWYNSIICICKNHSISSSLIWETVNSAALNILTLLLEKREHQYS